MLKETETEETIGFFVTFLSVVEFQLWVEGLPHISPLSTPMIVTSMLFVILRFCKLFASLPLCACQSDTNGSNLYD